MATKPLSAEILTETLRVIEQFGGVSNAARAMGISRSTLQARYAEAQRRKHEVFEVEQLPSPEMSADELRERKRADFKRTDAAHKARELIRVDVKLDGPIGIAHGGDPHLDDDGCNLPLLERHVEIIRKTDGMLGANVGDLRNNWIGRLARLYGDQSTSAAEALTLVEWYLGQMKWLYLVAGNHDVWSGVDDPVQWFRGQVGVYEWHGVRLNLVFPNGKQVRVNAKHDFPGHSMWNTAHGPARAAQMGWRDQILTCGHKHTSGYQLLKDPSSGLISHAIRVGTYKVHDGYARRHGFPNQNIFECPVTIIDPFFSDDDKRLVTFIPDPEEAAEYLTWKRKKWKRTGKSAA